VQRGIDDAFRIAASQQEPWIEEEPPELFEEEEERGGGGGVSAGPLSVVVSFDVLLNLLKGLEAGELRWHEETLFEEGVATGAEGGGTEGVRAEIREAEAGSPSYSLFLHLTTGPTRCCHVCKGRFCRSRGKGAAEAHDVIQMQELGGQTEESNAVEEGSDPIVRVQSVSAGRESSQTEAEADSAAEFDSEVDPIP